MSSERLRKQSRKSLESLARRRGISHTRTLRKDELVDALSSAASKRPVRPSTKPSNGSPRANDKVFTAPAPRPAIARRVVPDQLEVSTQDLHWLRVGWEIGRASIDRAAAALGPDWHRAVAVLRVADVTGDDRSRGMPRNVIEIELPAGSSAWFVRVDEPDRAYRVTLGFRARSGRFHQVIQSRSVVPARSMPSPRPGARPAARVEDAEGWPLDLYAGRAQPQAPRPHDSSEPVAAVLLRAAEAHEACGPYDVPPMPFQVEAELIVRGAASQNARVSLQGKPVTVSRDGRFCQRVPLQAGRQVVPVVATAGDRSQERTVVLALELSARELEPRIFDDL
jgi:hypothetical protein